MKDKSLPSTFNFAQIFPSEPAQRSQWIVDRRPRRAEPDPYKPYAYLVEDECSSTMEIVTVATIFLTNRECPWRCTMCDLWKNTLTETVPVGAIAQQIDYALERLPVARQVKLYNSGSFFDGRAIPKEDYVAIAQRVNNFERTIVECHPSLVGESCVEFCNLIASAGNRLEVAIGLETAHPQVLEQLNKRMTLEHFSAAADFLRDHEVDLRVFILVQPPFMRVEESLEWAQRSLDFAFDRGATAVTLIPTRAGNGAMEALAKQGEFTAPTLSTVEAAARYGIGLRRGRVFVDLWDMRTRPNACPACIDARVSRLHQMNLSQQILPSAECLRCGGLS